MFVTKIFVAAFVVLSSGAYCQNTLNNYPVSGTTANWTTQNYNASVCSIDANCTYLTTQYNITYPCCATATLVSPQGTYTTIGTGCISSATQYYNSFFAYSNGTRILIKCGSRISYLPVADNQTTCYKDSECPTGQCCNKNNATYQNTTSNQWVNGGYCMPTSKDKTNINWNQANANFSFQINQMCSSTASIVVGQAARSTSTPTLTPPIPASYTSVSISTANSSIANVTDNSTQSQTTVVTTVITMISNITTVSTTKSTFLGYRFALLSQP